MRKAFDCISALALVSALSACGGREEVANNVAAENDMNAMIVDSGPLASNEVTTPAPPAPAAEKAPAVKPAAPKPASPPAKPKPAEPADPAPDPTCAPEHRAAGHC